MITVLRMCTKTITHRCQGRDLSPRTPVAWIGPLQPWLSRICSRARATFACWKRRRKGTNISHSWHFTSSQSYQWAFHTTVISLVLQEMHCVRACVLVPLHYTSQVLVLVANVCRKTRILHQFLNLHYKGACYIHIHRVYASPFCNRDISGSYLRVVLPSVSYRFSLKLKRCH